MLSGRSGSSTRFTESLHDIFAVGFRASPHDSLFATHPALRVVSSQGDAIASVPLAGFDSRWSSDWQEVRYSFTSLVRDTQASVEITAEGTGTPLSTLSR
jgi:hypothetical protein